MHSAHWHALQHMPPAQFAPAVRVGAATRIYACSSPVDWRRRCHTTFNYGSTDSSGAAVTSGFVSGFSSPPSSPDWSLFLPPAFAGGFSSAASLGAQSPVKPANGLAAAAPALGEDEEDVSAVKPAKGFDSAVVSVAAGLAGSGARPVKLANGLAAEALAAEPVSGSGGGASGAATPAESTAFNSSSAPLFLRHWIQAAHMRILEML